MSYDYHSHSEYAQEGHRHDYAHEGHEHPLWQVSGAASDSHSHDMSQIWDAIDELSRSIADLRGQLGMLHQDS